MDIWQIIGDVFLALILLVQLVRWAHEDKKWFRQKQLIIKRWFRRD